MIWDIEEREQKRKEIEEYLNGGGIQRSEGLLPTSEHTEKIWAEAWEEEKRDLLNRIIKDEDGNWIGLVYAHTTPSLEALLSEINDDEYTDEDNN